MFSPFDALTAEFFLGRRISDFFARPEMNHSATTDSSFCPKESARSSRSAAVNSGCKLPKSATAAARPARFAPEFDGLHCFETLVSH